VLAFEDGILLHRVKVSVLLQCVIDVSAAHCDTVDLSHNTAMSVIQKVCVCVCVCAHAHAIVCVAVFT
jgi:hypothetical protein